MTQRTTKLRSIVVYLQPNERQAVVELAAEARLSVSNFIRGMLGLPELARGAAKKPRAVAVAKPPRYDEPRLEGASPAPADGVPPASAGTPASAIRRLEGFPTLRRPPATPAITDDEINDLLAEIEEEP